MRMPQEENRAVNRMVEILLQPSMDDDVSREFWIRLDRARRMIGSRVRFAIVRGQRAGSAFILCGRISEGELAIAIA